MSGNLIDGLFRTDSDEQFLGLIFEDIFDQFISRKKDCVWINRGQIAYAASNTWAENFIKRGFYKTDLYVDHHLGYLAARPDAEVLNDPNVSYTTITTQPQVDRPICVFIIPGMTNSPYPHILLTFGICL